MNIQHFHLTDYSVKQVPLTAPHPVPDQLLALHATLRLYLWYNGQIFGLIIRKLAPKEGGSTGRGAPDTSHDTGIHIPSTPRIRVLSFWTSEVQLVPMADVAGHHLVQDAHLDLWAHVHGREECVQTPKTANMGYSQIQCSSTNSHWLIPIQHILIST